MCVYGQQSGIEIDYRHDDLKTDKRPFVQELDVVDFDGPAGDASFFSYLIFDILTSDFC